MCVVICDYVRSHINCEIENKQPTNQPTNEQIEQGDLLKLRDCTYYKLNVLCMPAKVRARVNRHSYWGLTMVSAKAKHEASFFEALVKRNNETHLEKD